MIHFVHSQISFDFIIAYLSNLLQLSFGLNLLHFDTHKKIQMAMTKSLVVAGGGVVGLSVARAAARAGFQVLLLEKNARAGMETSARSSEVVHGASCSVFVR